MLEEIVTLASIFALCGLPVILSVLVSPMVGALTSGVLGYVLYLALAALFDKFN